MNREDLKQARDHWYSAYFAGEVEHLIRIQADTFRVTSERGVQSKKCQIAAINLAKRNGDWFPQGGHKCDIELSIRFSGSSATITGRGFTISGETKGPVVEFTETWEWDGVAWQVISLSYGANLD